MKDEYDLSQGEQSRFYSPGALFNIPIYLDKDNLEFVEKIAQARHTDIEAVVNELVRSQAQASPGPET